MPSFKYPDEKILNVLNCTYVQHTRTKHDLLDVLSGFCRCLHEDQAMFVCKLHAFVVAHCTPVRQITFVPNQHYRHVGVGVLPHILRTAHEVIESLPCGINPTWIPMVLSA